MFFDDSIIKLNQTNKVYDKDVRYKVSGVFLAKEE